MKTKISISLIIVLCLLLPGCSRNSLQKVSNYGTSYIYNGKTFTLYSQLGVKAVGKQVGVTDDKAAIYEIDGQDSNKWLAVKDLGLVIYFVLKEKSVPDFRLDNFPVDEIQITTTHAMKISIKDKKTIDDLIYLFKNASKRTIIPSGGTPPDELDLVSSSSNLVYVLSYFHSNDGKEYIIERSNLTGEAVEIGDILKKYTSVQ